MRNSLLKYSMGLILSLFLLSSCTSLRPADYTGVPEPRKYKSKKSTRRTSSTRSKTKTPDTKNTGSVTTSVSAKRNSLIDTARKYKGVKYVMGGETPRKGFDCSGFTSYVMEKHNVKIPRTSKQQAKDGKKIPIKKAQPGDLLFFGQRGKVSHVGIITKNEKGVLKVIHSTSSSGVMEQNVIASGYWKKRIMFARRVM